MKSIKPPLLLAVMMIGTSLFATLNLIPKTFAQYSPLLLLALFPGAWLQNRRCCDLAEWRAA